ncbi:Ubiquitin- modifier 1 [Malassezia vespertilionis]|uniref:Ubiquitin- modifier 1 n=1 Tax=Malassezia vespertilionis TaxID=2020962 RepID=UPI0024B2682E|nr:Ubiquitin- modifier 1 [Malassezia vespertilionis]WFD05022.1 Ubiquitin- modifier 1 [Malassezia vespertilionis]
MSQVAYCWRDEAATRYGRIWVGTVSSELTYSGGTELLLAPPHAKTHELTLPWNEGKGGTKRPDVRALVDYIKQNLITEREELFVEGDNVDWELEGEMDYVLQDKDHVVFISTLHGG